MDDAPDYGAKARMEAYDRLPEHKRRFIQRYHHLFGTELVKKHKLVDLIKARPKYVQNYVKSNYGKDHPQAGEK